jgi:hypothetical protein
MADHTAPDYYEQVAKETSEELKSQDEKIRNALADILSSHINSLRKELEREFGRAVVSCADLSYLEDVLTSAAYFSADAAKSVMIDSHYKETRKSLNHTIDCVLSGMKLSGGSK